MADELKGGPSERDASARWVSAIAGAGGLTLFIVLFALAPKVILAAFAAVLWGVFLSSISRFLSRRTGWGYRWALLATLLALLLATVGFCWFAGHRMAEQFADLSDRVPRSIEDLRQWVRDQGFDGVAAALPDPEKLFSDRSSAMSEIGGAVGTALSAAVYGLVILALGIYLAVSPQLYSGALLALVPQGRRPRVEEILASISKALQWWLVGRISSMAVVGILTLIGLWALGIPLAIPLAIIAAALSFIPNIGPVLSAVPAVLVGFSEGPTKALYVMIVYVVVQTIESYAITPLIQKKAVSLPPAAVLTVQILFSVLWGGFGLLVATPMTVAFTVIVQKVYIRGILNDPVRVLGEH